MFDSVDVPYAAGPHNESARIFFRVGGKQLDAYKAGSQQTWFGSLALPLSSECPQARLLTSLNLHSPIVRQRRLDKAPHWVTFKVPGSVLVVLSPQLVLFI